LINLKFQHVNVDYKSAANVYGFAYELTKFFESSSTQRSRSSSRLVISSNQPSDYQHVMVDFVEMQKVNRENSQVRRKHGAKHLRY
jgi:hypothetical protein